jgi:hypothetical protein
MNTYAKAYEIGLGKKPVNTNLTSEKIIAEKEVDKNVNDNDKYIGTSNPKIWGPHYWYNLHNSSLHYPLNASPIVKERIKNRILAIPYEISCRACQIHASAYIEQFSEKELDDIVSTRDNLFKFYVDFHNSVNKRLGKPIWSVEEAKKFYNKN